MSANIIAKQRLYLNADKSKLVDEGDERAAFLFCGEGDEITPETHERFGLVEGALPAKKAKAEQPAAPVNQKPAAPAKPKPVAKKKVGTKPAATGETKPAGDGEAKAAGEAGNGDA